MTPMSERLLTLLTMIVAARNGVDAATALAHADALCRGLIDAAKREEAPGTEYRG